MEIQLSTGSASTDKSLDGISSIKKTINLLPKVFQKCFRNWVARILAWPSVKELPNIFSGMTNISRFSLICSLISTLFHSKISLFYIQMKKDNVILFLTNLIPLVSFYTPFWTSENVWYSNIFWGYRKREVVWNGSIELISEFCENEILEEGYLH